MGSRIRAIFFLCFALFLVGCGGSSSPGGGGSNNQPGFSISAPSSITVTPNSTQTISISVTAENGFSSPVDVALSGLPAGVTALPASFVLNAAASSSSIQLAEGRATPGVHAEVSAGASYPAQIVTITSNGSVPAGPVSLTVTGTSGSITQSSTTTTTQADFALAVAGPITLTAGSTAQISISAEAFGGFSGQIATTLIGLPPGVTSSPSSIALTPGVPQTVTLTAAQGTVAQNAIISLVGTSGDLSHNVDLLLELFDTPAAPDFSLSVAPGAVTLQAGGPVQTFSVSAAALSGFSGLISVSLSGLPSGVVAIPANFSLTPGVSQQVQLSAGSTASGGTANVTVIGASGDLSHTAQVGLTIQPIAPGFSLSINPGGVTLPIGGSTEQVSVTANAIGAFTSPVSVALTGLPSGVTAMPSSFTVNPGSAAQMVTLQARSSAAAGQSSITVQGSSGGLNNSTTLSLTVAAATPDFQIFAGPATLNLSPTYIQPLTISLLPLNGFNNAATVTVSGLPGGVTITNTPLPLVADIAQNLNLQDINASTGQSTITITATSGTVTHSTQVTLNVLSTASDFGAGIENIALTGNLGPGFLLTPGTFNFAILADATSGAPVSVQLSGLAAGLSLSQDQFIFTSTAGEDFTITIPASAVGELGVLQAVFTGTGISHELDIPFHVLAQPSIVSYVPALSIPQGYSSNLFYEVASTSQNAIQFSLGPNWPQNFWLTPQGSTQNVSASASQALGGTDLPFEFDVDSISQVVSIPTQVTSSGDFSISASPGTIGLNAGASQTFSVTASPTNGFTAPINVSLDQVPAGLTVAPQSFLLIPGTPQTVTITAGSGYSSGGALSISAVSGGLSHYTQVAVSPGPYTGDLVATGNDFTAFGYVKLYTSATYSNVNTGLGDPNVQVDMGYVLDQLAMPPPYVSNCAGSTTNQGCTPIPLALTQWDLSPSSEPLDRNKTGTVVLQANFGGGEQYAILPFSETLPDYALTFTPTTLTIPAGGSAELSYSLTTGPATLPPAYLGNTQPFCGGTYYLNASELQDKAGSVPVQLSFYGTPQVPPPLQRYVEVLENVLPCGQTPTVTIMVLATAPPGNYEISIPTQLLVGYEPFVGGQSDNNYALIGAAHTYGVSLTITAPTN